MVSLRCKMLVKSVLDESGLAYMAIELGEVDLTDPLDRHQREILNAKLKRSGLELLEGKKSILIEKVKNIIVEMIHYNDDAPTLNFSEYLCTRLNYDYNYLSNLFSEVKGITISQFIIAHKIERAKELLVYDELTLTEIADKLHYSSVAHLSKQFKKVTGLTPSFFKKMKEKRMNMHESL